MPKTPGHVDAGYCRFTLVSLYAKTVLLNSGYIDSLVNSIKSIWSIYMRLGRPTVMYLYVAVSFVIIICFPELVWYPPCPIAYCIAYRVPGSNKFFKYPDFRCHSNRNLRKEAVLPWHRLHRSVYKSLVGMHHGISHAELLQWKPEKRERFPVEKWVLDAVNYLNVLLITWKQVHQLYLGVRSPE